MKMEKFNEISVPKVDSNATKFLNRIETILNIINQMCIGFITIYMSWLCIRNNLRGTALHAWLATIGFVFLMAEAIMCHYNNNVLTFSYRRKTKTTIHWILQLLGGGCAIAGVSIKLNQNKLPLHSLHGKLGFAAFILCLISMLSGLIALFSVTLRRVLSPLFNKTLHNIIGISTFVLALAAQYYGYTKHLITKNVSTDFQILLQVITLIILFLTSIGPLKALYNKISSIFCRQ